MNPFVATPEADGAPPAPPAWGKKVAIYACSDCRDAKSTRLARERRTIEAMVRMYCRDHHAGGLCLECRGLLDYANLRIDRCRFGSEKPTCAKCPVHCYQRDRREQVRKVMRYSGPRMLWEHPILSLWHLVDGMRKPVKVQ